MIIKLIINLSGFSGFFTRANHRGDSCFEIDHQLEAKVTADLVSGLAMPPSEASKVARCAAADWHAPDDWKRKVVEAIERSANVARVFLLVARADEGWVTIPSYANKNGPPRFEPMSKYEKWLARPLAVLPASDLLSFVSLAALRRAVLTRCAIRRDHGVGSGRDTVATVRFSLREPTSHLRDCRARTSE